MASEARHGALSRTTLADKAATAEADDHPVREYIGAMAQQLALMARWDGDETLARMLEAAVSIAAEPAPEAQPLETQPRRPRPA